MNPLFTIIRILDVTASITSAAEKGRNTCELQQYLNLVRASLRSSLMSKMNVANLTHIFRECNATADSLAKCSNSHELGLVCFDNPPAHAAQAFLDDLSSVSKARTGNYFSI